MTNYLNVLACATLIAGTACANDTTPPAAKPAAAKPAGATGAVAHYVQAPGSSLGFSFEQAGAVSHGTFKQFATTFVYDEKNLPASSLNVKVQIASLDTQDQDRNSTLVGADLLDAAKYPTATYAAGSLAKGANGIEALGKLTIRGVTRDLRVPLTIRTTPAGLELSGAVTIKRLDYGVGQGEWKSTESVGDPVELTYKVVLKKAG
jgi:polyisoprenoid-binding protein YceI